MEQLVRYVPANPLRAGVCKTPTDLENYRWTGHAVLMGTREAAFQDTWPVLRRFGRTVADGRRGNAEFVAEAVNQSSERLSVLRKGNTDRDRWTPGLYVIGDPECRGARLRHTSTPLGAALDEQENFRKALPSGSNHMPRIPLTDTDYDADPELLRSNCCCSPTPRQRTPATICRRGNNRAGHHASIPPSLDNINTHGFPRSGRRLPENLLPFQIVDHVMLCR